MIQKEQELKRTTYKREQPASNKPKTKTKNQKIRNKRWQPTDNKHVTRNKGQVRGNNEQEARDRNIREQAQKQRQTTNNK